MRVSRPLASLRHPIHSRGLSTTARYAQRVPVRTEVPLSRNIPQVDYLGGTAAVASLAMRLVKILVVGGVTVVGVGTVAFEGLHQYIETGPLSIPSRGNDEYGWEDEVQGWTGGPKGGTDPRLGWKARHAIRAAWMCQSWGAGDASVSSGRQGFFEPDYFAVRGMIGVDPTIVRPDRGYEMANAFLTAALDAARAKGLVFPPALSVLRTPGPPTSQSASAGHSNTSATQGDPAVVDLLLLKAGALERMGSSDSLSHAKEIYEQVVSAIHSDADPIHEARIMRLAGKVGSLCARMGDGDEALAWWGWGLSRVGLELPSKTTEVKAELRSWFGKSPAPVEQPTLPTSLPPPILRATISLLTTASTHLATRSHIAAASSLQTTALALLPAPRPIPRADPSTAGMILHHTWLEQRSALLTLHLASTTYAQGRPAVNLATIASARADQVLEAIEPLPRVYTRALKPASQLLRRDALLTAAEASYTRALLLERQPEPPLELIAECFERSMTLSALESGKTEAKAMGSEWEKYYESFARVKEKLGQSVE
ncbi:hypothetical protein DB88DRAFT_464828 [Papiliotrema laurentii]|uniref:Uncharacterized protein n=1 Tax=Papiliotrema laurentii TaxID=5418 RepID=A0AAD9FPI2_PAPLA|nr:hypothetical protein DB88DRAFT_464828 [Papiliotrema laurentii]